MGKGDGGVRGLGSIVVWVGCGMPGQEGRVKETYELLGDVRLLTA